MHRTQVYLPEDAYQELLEHSRRRGMTMAAVIRKAVKQYLRQERPQSFRDSVEASFGAWSGRAESTEQIVQAVREEWNERDRRPGRSAFGNASR